MSSATDAPSLAAQRYALLRSIAAIGDCRPGSLVQSYRKCGRPNCRRAAEDHPCHGPQWLLTTKSGGKTFTRQVAAAELDTVRAQTAEYRRLRGLYRELLQVSERCCEAGLDASPVAAGQAQPGKKKPSRRSLPPPSKPSSTRS